MEETRLALPKWFAAIFLLITSPRVVSSMAVSRELGISYKSAWLLARRIRAGLSTQPWFADGPTESWGWLDELAMCRFDRALIVLAR